MGRKININESIVKDIIINSQNLSIRGLGEKFSLNKNVIIRILKESKENKKKNIESLKCLKTGTIFYDIKNKSGILTKHLKTIYDDFNLNELSNYFEINYNNENYISFKSFLIKQKIKFTEKTIFNGLIKFTYPKIDRTVFFIENNKIAKNNKIKPILFFKLKNRYNNSIFIYEDEWVNKQTIVENKIKLILNVFNVSKIFARKCMIKEIDPQTKIEFLNNFHIQGNTNSKLALGAYYNDELVAVMSFTDKRNMTKNTTEFDYELNRFATNNKYHIIGIGDKLFKDFLKRIPKNSIIVSFGDRRYVLSNQNNLYRKLNFSLNQISKHDYTYKDINSINRIHKITMQGKFKKLNLKITETEYYLGLGYKKIWDCGKYRFTYINK